MPLTSLPGLVEESIDARDARIRIYRLRREPFDGLHRSLADVTAFWDDQLDAFKRHAERTSGGESP